MMGVMGNKGGVGIRFRLHDSSMCFVSCHLAAHRENVKARNENYHKILREMVFPPLPSGEWRRPQQRQQQQQHQRRASSMRRAGSSLTSPAASRRQSMSIRLSKNAAQGAGAGAGEPGAPPSLPSPSRRRLTLAMAAPSSLSGILSPRYRNASAIFMPSSPTEGTSFSSSTSTRTVARGGRVTARSLSPPTSPDQHKPRQTDQRQRPQQQRGRPAGSRKMGSPPSQPKGTGRSAKPRRRRSASMSWSSASFSSIMPSSSASSVATSCLPPPPPPLFPPSPVGPAARGRQEAQPLPSALTITVVPPGKVAAVTPAAGSLPATEGAAAEPGRCPPKGIAANAWTSPTRDASFWSCSAGGVPATARQEIGGKTRNKLAEDAGAVSRDTSLTTPTLGTTSVGKNSSGSNTASSSRGELASMSVDGDSGGLCNSFDSAKTNIETRSGVFGQLAGEVNTGYDGDGSDRDSGDDGDVPVEEASGGGKPTQVLRVPDKRARTIGEHLGIQDHDAVFWFGDLNYRIEASVDSQEVLGHAVSRRLGILAAKDQLNGARGAGDAFEGFQEAPIDFPPTYKYTAGTDDYDTRNDKKFRAPAWCDRILAWTLLSQGKDETRPESPKGTEGIKAGVVRQLSYRRSETPLMSDHKPVSASFRFGCKQARRN
ncbi:unnamed protein product [Hapterophycus canaliculatus]